MSASVDAASAERLPAAHTNSSSADRSGTRAGTSDSMTPRETRIAPGATPVACSLDSRTSTMIAPDRARAHACWGLISVISAFAAATRSR